MFALALLAAVSYGATVPKPYADLQACRTEADPTRRLACYDSTAAVLDAATKSEALVMIDRQELRKARKGLFGFALPRIGFLTGHGGRGADDEEFTRIETKVDALRSLPYGRYHVTLEGGALWETIEPFDAFRDPKAGDAVVVEKGLMGAYKMKIGKGRPVQAKRIG